VDSKPCLSPLFERSWQDQLPGSSFSCFITFNETLAGKAFQRSSIINHKTILTGNIIYLIANNNDPPLLKPVCPQKRFFSQILQLTPQTRFFNYVPANQQLITFAKI
jgi:hypothetical protein